MVIGWTISNFLRTSRGVKLFLNVIQTQSIPCTKSFTATLVMALFSFCSLSSISLYLRSYLCFFSLIFFFYLVRLDLSFAVISSDAKASSMSSSSTTNSCNLKIVQYLALVQQLKFMSAISIRLSGVQQGAKTSVKCSHSFILKSRRSWVALSSCNPLTWTANL